MKNPASPGKVVLGKAIRRLRASTNLTQDQFGKRMGYSRGVINNFENAYEIVHPDFLIRAAAAFGVDEVMRALHWSAVRYGFPDWVKDLTDAERQAVTIWSFGTNYFHGLTQTPDYMRGLFTVGQHGRGSLEQIELAMDQRLGRQGVLAGEVLENCHFLVDEAALQRVVGGRDVLYGQLERTLELIESQTITFQVFPNESGAYRAGGSMTIYRLQDESKVVHLPQAVDGTTTTDHVKVESCVEEFQRLCTSAADPEQSIRMIKKRMEELRP